MKNSTESIMENKMEQQLRELQKMASLGLLSAGIAHEIQNPLNFVLNFSKMSDKLLSDLKELVADVEQAVQHGEAPDSADLADIGDIATDLQTNMQKIREHGERAVSVIQGILLLSRGKEGEQLSTDVPHIIHEYVWLSYHAMRAKDKTFNVSISENYPQSMPKLMIVPQDLSRAVLNIANNAFYAVHHKKQELGEGYHPEFSITVEYTNGYLSISLADNGTGMPPEVSSRIFHEIITTKPIGQGTGLGMSITHDLIVNHLGGKISFETCQGQGTRFVIEIPCRE